MTNTDKKREPVPKEFRSEEEAAEFWDKHSIADYEDLLEPVEFEVDLRAPRKPLRKDLK